VASEEWRCRMLLVAENSHSFLQENYLISKWNVSGLQFSKKLAGEHDTCGLFRGENLCELQCHGKKDGFIEPT
jgi:hypothetical protein